MKKFSFIQAGCFYFLLILAFLLCGCGGDTDPLKSIIKNLKNVSTYSVILEDMKEEGNFFKSYFHKYRIVQPEDGWTTDWLKVDEKFYKLNENFMGMTIAGKKDGKSLDAASPPGYQYVGDPRYGQWRREGGTTFWEFYGKYRLLTDFFGGWYRPVYMPDFDDYRYHRSKRMPYYGKNKQFGTSGSIVKYNKPDFYSRRMSMQKRQSTSFADKVNQRIGRSRTGLRGRSGSRGK